MSTDGPVVVIDGLTKKYGDLLALDHDRAVLRQLGLVVCLSAALTGLAVVPAPAVELDFARDLDPVIKPAKAIAPIPRFASRLKPLWLEALARPEADLKRQAADAIARAHRLGMPALAEAVPPLLRELEAPDAHPVVRLAVARALAALDARQAAPVLMRHAQRDGLDAARLLEPILARWNYAPMRPVWLARLASPRTSPELLLLAVQAAAIAKLSDAAPQLRRLALDPKVEVSVRLAAARALAPLQPTGLEADAHRLADGAGPQNMIDRLVAATLLTHDRGPAVETLLLRLAGDPEPAVAVVASGRLAEINPGRLEPLLDHLATSGDSGLRRLAAQVLAELHTPETVAKLGPLLDDPHRELRVSVRESMIRLADMRALSESVREAAVRILNAKGPRGREQAAIVIGAVRYEPATQRLVQLLDDRAGEVRVAAAWALRRLAVPATAAAILERVRAATKEGRQRRGPKSPPEIVPSTVTFQQMGHLIEALGVMRYRPATPLLKEYLPLPPPPKAQALSGLPANLVWQNSLRAAAVWSLGRIYAGDPQSDLAATLRKRLGDDAEPVRVMAAVGIGRMKARDLVPPLRQVYQDETEPLVIRRACAWSLGQLTGAPVTVPDPPPKPREIWYSGWFLEPLDR